MKRIIITSLFLFCFFACFSQENAYIKYAPLVEKCLRGSMQFVSPAPNGDIETLSFQPEDKLIALQRSRGDTVFFYTILDQKLSAFWSFEWDLLNWVVNNTSSSTKPKRFSLKDEEIFINLEKFLQRNDCMKK